MHRLNNIKFRILNSGVYWMKGSVKKCCVMTPFPLQLQECTEHLQSVSFKQYVYHEFSWPRNISTILNQMFSLWIEVIFHFENWLVFLAHLVWWSEGKYHFLLSRYILNNRKKKALRSSNDPQKEKWCKIFLVITKDDVIRIEPHPCQLWAQRASSATGTTHSFLWVKAARIQRCSVTSTWYWGQECMEYPPPYTSSRFCDYLSTGANFMLCIPCGFYTGPNYVITNVYSAEIYSQGDMRTKSSEQKSLPPPTRQWNINKHIINTAQMFPVYILNLIIKTIFGTISNKYWNSWILTLFTGYHFTRYCLSVRQICKFILTVNKSHLIKQPM